MSDPKLGLELVRAWFPPALAKRVRDQGDGFLERTAELCLDAPVPTKGETALVVVLRDDALRIARDMARGLGEDFDVQLSSVIEMSLYEIGELQAATGRY